MKCLVAILLLSSSAWASLPELFGPSAGSIAIGNQAEKNSAANNYHAASLLGYSERTQFSFNTFYIAPAFKEINNVVVLNGSNTVATPQKKGDVDVNPSPTAMFSAHLSTPLFSPTGPKFNFSVFAPVDRLMEADTGDPYKPRYVMYENRFIRPILIFSLAQAYKDWGFSAGVHTGLQSNGETYFVTKTTAGEPSVGKIGFNAKASVGYTASVSKKWDQQLTYFTFQQEMQSKLENRASGETELSSTTTIPFDFDITTLLYFDPMTLRLGHQVHLEDKSLFFTVEYQQWDTFKNSTLKMKRRAGTINGSSDQEDLKLRNIVIPKIGYEQKLAERWIGKIGYFYRPTPLKTQNLKNAGNSIDADKHVGSLGITHLFNFLNKELKLDLAYQGHLLKKTKITKTAGREDGDPSEGKIGSPGYRVGGMIHVLSVGLSWMY